MKTIFHFLLVYIFYVYIGYPSFLKVCILFRKIGKLRDNKEKLKVTMFIPAYNEQNIIKEKIENCLKLNYPKDKIQFILVLDGCTDKTETIASSSIDDRFKMVKLQNRNGKAKALKKAVSEATGDIYVFTDANAIYDESAINKLIRNFIDDSIAGVCGNLIYRDSDVNQTLQAEGVYWRYENYIKKLESEMGTLVTANGSIYAIRNKYFLDIDDDLADDFLIALNIASKGKRLVYEPEAKAYEIAPQEAQEEFRRRIRIINQGIKISYRYASLIIKSKPLFIIEYLSHKLLRWFIPFIMVSILIVNYLLMRSYVYNALFALQIIFYSLALAGLCLEKKKVKLKLLSLPFYFCLLNAAALFGIFSAIFQKKFNIWEKAQTTR
jgi:cellulose synthase/poly-beta-1,6-N-acetylglucosamine synthase-like glycosyltransferase